MTHPPSSGDPCNPSLGDVLQRVPMRRTSCSPSEFGRHLVATAGWQGATLIVLCGLGDDLARIVLSGRRLFLLGPQTLSVIHPIVLKGRGIVLKGRKVFNPADLNQIKILHGSLLFVFSMSTLPLPPNTHTDTLSNRVLWTSGYEADFEPPSVVDSCRCQKRCVQIT